MINKHVYAPLTSNTNEDGVRDFMHDMGNEIIYVDKVGLEDLNTFHEVDFDDFGDYYFNQGRYDQSE